MLRKRVGLQVKFTNPLLHSLGSGILIVIIYAFWSTSVYERMVYDTILVHSIGRADVKAGVQSEIVCEQASRQQHVKEVCKNWHMTEVNAKKAWFFVDTKHRLLFCHVPKAASTTIINAMKMSQNNASRLLKSSPQLYSKVHDMNVLKKFGLKIMTFDEAAKLENYTSFFVTRHPYARLESAFNNKIFHGPRTKSLYRGKAFLKFAREHDLGVNFKNTSDEAFPIFAKHFVYADDEDIPYSRDHHWTPMIERCNPCVWDFDYILREETLASDSGAVMKLMGYPSNYLQRTRKNSEAKPKRRNIAKRLQYFHMLSEQDVQRLQAIYKLDMALFGYQYNFETATATCHIPTADGKGVCC